MNKNLALLGSVSGILGIVICFISGLGRVAGFYYIMGFQSTTVFNAGVGLMVFACLMKLDALQSRQRE